MMARLLVFLTAVFAGALAIEVLQYHQVAVLQSDRWAQAPQLSGPLLICAAFLVLAWPNRSTIGLFAISCGVSVAVGVAGTLFHFASHSLAFSNATVAATWLGDPPPLAPLEFAVAGLIGLLPVAWKRAELLTLRAVRPASVCYALAALCSLVALGLAAVAALLPAVGSIVVAMVVGTLGAVTSRAYTRLLR